MSGSAFISKPLDDEDEAVKFLDGISGLSAYYCRRCEQLVLLRDSEHDPGVDDSLECPVCREGPAVGQIVTFVGGRVLRGVVESRHQSAGQEPS